MTGNGITVGFSALDTAASDISTGANGIGETLDNLERKLQALEADWDGDAKDAYRDAKAQWNGALNDMKLLLGQIGTTVSSSNDAYRDVQGKATRAWSPA